MSDYQLTIDSITSVRALIDSAIVNGQTEKAWALSGQHALMVRQAAAMRAPIVSEALRAESLAKSVAAMVTPAAILKGAAEENDRQAAVRAEELAYEASVRNKAAREASDRAAAEKAKLEEKQQAKRLAEEELQSQALVAEIAGRVAKELASRRKS